MERRLLTQMTYKVKVGNPLELATCRIVNFAAAYRLWAKREENEF